MQKSSKVLGCLLDGKIPHWIFPTVVATITCAVYLPIFRNEFVDWDDYAALLNNPHYRGFGWNQLRWMFTTFYLGPYQPLSWMSYALDYMIWGVNPAGYHLTNLVFHAANASLFYFVSRRILAMALSISHEQESSQLELSAAFAALLFAIHPLRVESVAWATERRDVLSGFFFLATIHWYLQAVSAPLLRTPSRRLWIAIVLYALSLLAKATSMTLPLVLGLLDIFPLRRLPMQPWVWLKPQFRHVLIEKIPFLLLATIFAALALLGQQSAAALRQYEGFFRIAQTLYGLSFYLWKTLLPINLSPLYEVPFRSSQWTWVFVVGGAGVLIVAAILCFVARKWPALLAGWLYYAVVLLPVLGIVPFGPQLVADRYSYLSCLSWALLGGAGLLLVLLRSANQERRRRNVRLLSAVAVAGLFILGSLTWRQTKVWRNSRVLWEYVHSIEPASSIANDALGKILEAEGHDDQALEFYRRAVALNPENAGADFNLARLLTRKGQLREAVLLYRTALAVEPDNAVTHNNLGMLLALQGQVTEALEHLYRALALDPDNAIVFFNLGRVFSNQGQEETAVKNYRYALKLDPNQFEIHLQLGKVLERQGRLEEAKERFEAAVKLKPDLADARVALARSMAALGTKKEAEKQYQEAIRLLESQRKLPSDSKTID